MADTINANLTPDDSVVRKSVLKYYDSKIKAWVGTQVNNAIDGGFKDVKYTNSTLYFFDDVAPASADEYAAKAVKSVSLPEEQFLDQTKTTLVENFAWSEAEYPSSTNPKLDGDPVLVLAVKGEGTNVSYSFVSLKKFFNVYTGETTNSAKTTVSNDKISVDVNVSKKTGNIISVIETEGEQGLYAEAQDISGKADKVTNATEGNLAKLDANGNLADAGVNETDFVKKTTTIAGVDLADNVTKEEMLTALNVADGAQVNVIEKVKVNGAELTATDKAVDVTVATGATDGTLAVNGTDVAVKGYSELATAVGGNTTAIGILNGDENTAGSVAKAIKDYKDSIVYTTNDDIDALFATV